MKQRFTHLVAAAAAAAFCSPAVLAVEAYSSASLSGLHIELIDINPDDGIAPWLTFASIPGGGSSLNTVISLDYGPKFTDQQNSDTVFSALSSSSRGGTMASISGDLQAGTGLIQSTAVSGNSDGYSESRAQATPWAGATFALSPFTLMVVSGRASLHSSIPYNHFQDSATSEVHLGLTGDNGPDFQDSYAQLNASAHVGSEDDVDLSVQFINATSASIDGNFHAWAYTVASSGGMSVPTPEPASGILLLMGLAGLAARGYRHGRRGSEPSSSDAPTPAAQDIAGENA